MAKIQGGVPVAGFMSPTDDLDVYAVTKEEYNQGGYRSVATVDEMNTIPAERRKEGMLVFVIGEEKLYRLDNQNTFNEIQLGGNIDLSNMITKYDATKDYKLDQVVYNIENDILNIYRSKIENTAGNDISDHNNWELIYSSAFVEALNTLNLTGVKWKGVVATPDELLTLGSVVGDLYLVGDVATSTTFYLRIESQGTLRWAKIGSDGGSGGSYTNTSPTPVAIGGIPAGTTFNNLSMEEVFNMLFYPYQSPTFTAFSLSRTLYELGESTGTTLTASWNTNNQNNITPDSITLKFNNTEIGNSLPNSGTNQDFNITEVVKQTASTVPVTIELTNTKNNKVTRNINLEWVNTIYYGVNANPTITDVTGLTKLNTNSIARTYNFPATGYKYLVYPSSMPDSIEWKDEATNLAVPFEKLANITITNAHGLDIEYKVFRTLNVLGGAIKIIVK